ncbi:hypothetical protein P3S67_010229 [Capsicum chacoense]
MENESACSNIECKISIVDEQKGNSGDDGALVEVVDVNEHDRTIISDTNHNEVLIGQFYKDKATKKSMMRLYAIRNRFQFDIIQSNAVGYNLVCKSKEFCWLLMTSSSKKTDFFKTRRFCQEHTCPLKDKVYEQKHVSSALIGGIAKQKLPNHKRVYTAKYIQYFVMTFD